MSTSEYSVFHSWLSLPRDEETSKKIMTYIIGSNIVWFIMFFVIGLNHPLPKLVMEKTKPYDQLVLRHRLIQVYHGIVAFLMGLYWYIARNDRTCSKKIDDYELIMLVNTSGHFIWDVIFMKYHGFLDTGNLIHHLMGITTYYFGAYAQYNHNLIALNILPAELTNVNMHLREVFKRIGWRYTWAYYWNEYQYCFLYIICRSIWIPACYYWMYICDTINPAVLIIYPMHCVMSWYYVSMLPKLIKMRTVELKKIKKAGLKLEWFNPLSEAKIIENGIDTKFEAYKM